MNNYIRSFRLVCSPDEMATVERMLRLQGYEFEADPFFSPARRLTREPHPLGGSLAAFFGLIYIQDRASMLPPVALAPAEGSVVLDMCASPGSKTGQLAGLVGKNGLVLGNEPSSARLATLRRNMATMNLSQVATCCQKGERIPLPGGEWDHIQLDPPCSGWGTVERNPKVMDIWKDDKVKPLIALQRELLREAFRLLKPGGSMVFSTCTTNVEENEEQVLFARKELGLLSVPLDPVPGFRLADPLLGVDGVWRLELSPGDNQGFFVARFRKPEDAPMPENAGATESVPLSAQEFTPVPESMLKEQGINPAHLPGKVGMFGQSLHMVPDKALTRLPFSLHWQGMYFGKAGKNGEIHLSPRLRFRGQGPELHLEGEDGLQSLKNMIQGQSLPLNQFPLRMPDGGNAPHKTAKTALIVWENLPLARGTIKNNRVIWSER